MDTNTAQAPAPAVEELSRWTLKNSDVEFDGETYMEGLDSFAAEFNQAFAAVVETI